MRFRLLFLTACLLLARPASAADLATFIADVENLTRQIETTDAAGGRTLAANLPDTWQVQPGADAAFEVRTDWIKVALLQASREPAQWGTRRTALLARLAAVKTEAVALRDAEAQAATPAAARAALHEVLSRREFARNDTRTWTDLLRRQINKWVDALLDRLGGGPMAAGAVGRVLTWIVAIVALAALVFGLLRMRRPRAAWQPLALETPRLTSREWGARAAAALRDGDAREAIRCGYHAALFRLEEQGVWRVDDARTPREYLSLLPRHDARRVALADLTRDFELTWYGSQAADARGLLERLEVFGCRVQPESTTASS